MVTSDQYHGPHLLSTTEPTNYGLIRYFATKGNHEALLAQIPDPSATVTTEEATRETLIKLTTEFADQHSAYPATLIELARSVITILTPDMKLITKTPDPETIITPDAVDSTITPITTITSIAPPEPSTEETSVSQITGCKIRFLPSVAYAEWRRNPILHSFSDNWNEEEADVFFTSAFARWYTHTPGTATVTSPAIATTSPINEHTLTELTPPCTKDHFPETDATFVNAPTTNEHPYYIIPHIDREQMASPVRAHRPANCVFCAAITALRTNLPPDERAAARQRDIAANRLHQDQNYYTNPRAMPRWPPKFV